MRRLIPREYRPLEPVMAIARDWIGRFLGVQGIDRAMAIGAYAYSALIPLLIVYSSVLPRKDNRDFADELIDRFELHGSAASSVKLAFAPAGAVESSVTTLGVVLLIVSALSFTRGVQRLYELAFGLPTRGLRNTKWGIVWLVVLCILSVVRPWILGNLSGTIEIVGSLALATLLWLLTPYLLLGRRLSFRRLAPVAVLSTIGMDAVGVWSAIWLPHTIATSARQYGVIGIGFALLTWLVAVAGVLVVAATGGAMVSDRIDRYRQRGGRDVSLDGLPRAAAAGRGAAVQDQALADRAEPSREARR
jgi:membrane protein